MATGIGKAQIGGGDSGVYSKLHLVIPPSRVITLGSNPLVILPGRANTRIILDIAALFGLEDNPTIDYTFGLADTVGIFTDIGLGPTGQPSGDPLEANFAPGGVFSAPFNLYDQGVFQNQTFTSRITIGAPMYLATYQVNVGGADFATAGDSPLVVDLNYEYVSITP